MFHSLNPKAINKKYTEIIKKKIQSKRDDILHHLAFDYTLQANIISTVSSGKIVLVNRAACKLLGYSKKELLTKYRTGIFDIKESRFKKMLKQRTSEGHSIALATGIKKNAHRFTCEITTAIFKDQDGIKKSIITIADMSQSILKQKKIDIKKEKIVAENITLARTKQKNIDVKKKITVAQNIILAKSKQKNIDVKNKKIVADNIRLAKSKQKNIDARNQKIVAKNILLAQEKTNARIIENNKWLNLIFNSSPEVLYDSDLISDKAIMSDAYEKEFGYKITKNMTPTEDWISHIHPDDKPAVFQEYLSVLASDDTEWKRPYRFIKKDKSVVNVLTNCIILRDTDGKAYRIIGTMHETDKQKALEDRLEKEIKIKETLIAEALEEAKETERSDIGKELHDNVNQLLSASKLYLDLAKHGGKDTEIYLSRSSEYTHTAIEEIRKLTKKLTTDTLKSLGICEAIVDIARDAMEVNTIHISLALKTFIEKSVNEKFKLNLFRIIQEQLSNILKHAEATKATISLFQNNKSITLAISDNGVGFDLGKKSKGIGIANIKSRVDSYNGKIEFISQPGHGCTLRAKFPLTELLLNVN